MKLLINNTESVQPSGTNDTVVVLYGRNPENPDDRYRVNVYGFDPHFYVAEAEAIENETFLLEQKSIAEIVYGDYDAFNDDRTLAKIVTNYPQDIRAARELFDETWRADVPYTNQFRIASGMKAAVEVPDPETPGGDISCDWHEISPVDGGISMATPRVNTVDIEVDDRGDGFPELGDERILSIVAHDSYRDETVGFLDLNGRAIEDALPNGCPDNLDSLKVQDTERKMLIDFRSWFQEVDPDIVTGWNSDDFDIPFILKRMENIQGLNPSVLSPLGWAGVTRRGDPRIKGRTCYDLLDVYKANSFTELRSYKLDDVAEEELDEAKIEFDGGYYDLYENDTETFMVYNAHDVHLTVGINDVAGVIDFRDTLRREVGVDFEDSYNANDFIEMLCRRRLSERNLVGPTAEYAGHDDYEGAFVFDAYEGVAEHVVGMDLASLYPYTMAMLNASPETKVSASSGNCSLAANEVAFDLSEDGLFKELVDDAIGLKQEYKEKRDGASSDEEYKKWAKKYMAAKTITNAIYGTTGWERFFLYDKDVAAAVTLTGQKVIKRTAEFVSNSGYEVMYGDSVPHFEPVTVLNAAGDVDVLPIEEVYERFHNGESFRVWNDDGWSHIHNAIQKPNRKQMYRVRTGDGIVHVTEDHGLIRQDGTEVTPTDVNVGDELMHTPHNHPSFESTDDSIDTDTAWLWGLFVGDGTCGEYKCESVIKRQWKISGDNKETLERGSKILGEKGFTARVEYIDSDKYTGRLMVSETTELYNKYRRKFYTNDAKKRVPVEILNATDEVKRSFLEGYQAADGDKDKRYDKIFHRSHTNSETLAQGIAVLLQSLGSQCGVNVRDNYGKEYTRIWSRQRGGGTTVEAVEPVEYTGEYVYDLSTESEHFNAGVGTITVHNTDSVYVHMPAHGDKESCLAAADDLCNELNNKIYPTLAASIGISPEDNLWDIEVEAYMRRFFQAGKKKRYAYLATWKDGRDVENPEPTIKGFSSRRSDSAQLTVETETEVLELILSGNADKVSNVVFNAAQEIASDDPDWDRIGIPGGMNKKISKAKAEQDDYYAFSSAGFPQDAHPRAVWNANKILNTNITSGDKPKRIYLQDMVFDDVGRAIDVIAFINPSELDACPKTLRVDTSRMTDVLLLNSLGDILSSIDIDPKAAVRGQEQTGLGAF